ncbi:MAG: peptide ABC transporter ATP-binding protein, partial [Solirubrobacterales bacterium]|nr:peptide ABC transporter ATP-binding protein [Solirubrobacterales bacterium]
AAVLDLLAELRRELALAMLFISHDLGVVATVADRVIVLHAGQVCETAETSALLRAPAHRYTRTLLEAAPRPPGEGCVRLSSASPAHERAEAKLCETEAPTAQLHLE